MHRVKRIVGNHSMRVGQTGTNVLGLEIGVIGKNRLNALALGEQAQDRFLDSNREHSAPLVGAYERLVRLAGGRLAALRRISDRKQS